MTHMDEAEANPGPEFLAEEWEQVKELVFEYQQEPEYLKAWLDADRPSRDRSSLVCTDTVLVSCGNAWPIPTECSPSTLESAL